MTVEGHLLPIDPDRQFRIEDMRGIVKPWRWAASRLSHCAENLAQRSRGGCIQPRSVTWVQAIGTRAIDKVQCGSSSPAATMVRYDKRRK
jgi:hypothetical protein